MGETEIQVKPWSEFQPPVDGVYGWDDSYWYGDPPRPATELSPERLARDARNIVGEVGLLLQGGRFDPRRMRLYRHPQGGLIVREAALAFPLIGERVPPQQQMPMSVETAIALARFSGDDRNPTTKRDNPALWGRIKINGLDEMRFRIPWYLGDENEVKDMLATVLRVIAARDHPESDIGGIANRAPLKELVHLVELLRTKIVTDFGGEHSLHEYLWELHKKYPLPMGTLDLFGIVAGFHYGGKFFHYADNKIWPFIYRTLRYGWNHRTAIPGLAGSAGRAGLTGSLHWLARTRGIPFLRPAAGAAATYGLDHLFAYGTIDDPYAAWVNQRVLEQIYGEHVWSWHPSDALILPLALKALRAGCHAVAPRAMEWAVAHDHEDIRQQILWEDQVLREDMERWMQEALPHYLDLERTDLADLELGQELTEEELNTVRRYSETIGTDHEMPPAELQTKILRRLMQSAGSTLALIPHHDNAWARRTFNFNGTVKPGQGFRLQERYFDGVHRREVKPVQAREPEISKPHGALHPPRQRIRQRMEPHRPGRRHAHVNRRATQSRRQRPARTPAAVHARTARVLRPAARAIAFRG